MIKFLSKHKKTIFVITVLGFMVGIFVGLGAYLMGSASLSGAVADVGGKEIPYQQFVTRVNRVVDNLKENGTEVNDALYGMVKQDVFREMIIEELLSAEAGKLGIYVSDFEVSAEIHNTPQFMSDGAFNPRLYYNTIWNNFRMNAKQYESWRRQARLAAKFKQFIFLNVKISADEVKDYYLLKNKSLKNFEKDKDKITYEMTQEKFGHLANYFLRQLSTRIEIKNYLEQREKGS
ncbi:MAG: SurA N-terminal domain-containing protein [Elusimicrobia bacterium]|nr:SurA N-terminal domain-containing protein [Elusimicrobiota bacterium]